MTSVRNIYPLAPIQRGLWFASVTDPTSRVYHQQLRLGLRGPLDVRALERAFAGLIERHDVLRTAFAWEELDEPLQLVLDRAELPLRRVDLRGQGSEALERLATEEREQAFDLRSAPLMRVCLARVDEAAWECLWTHHHIILDGWSTGILLQEWRALYQGESLPSSPPYATFIAWLGQGDPSRAREHFHAVLADLAEPTPLPQLGAKTSHADAGYGELRTILPAADTRRIEARARELETTPSALFIGAFGLLLARHAGCEDALIGVTLSGRPVELAGATDMVGVFINTLPVRVSAAPSASVPVFLRELRAQLSRLQEHPGCSIAELKSGSALAQSPHLFEAIVVVENYPVAAGMTAPLGALEVSIDEAGGEAGRNHHPLSLIVAVEGGRSELRLSYARARFERGAIECLLSQLASIVRGLADCAPAATLADLPPRSPEERRRLLALGCGPSRPVPAEAIHECLERQARRTPDAPAVVSDRGGLSYRALDEEANRLSRFLIAAGVRAGDVVALALPRSIEFVVAMLAAFKAGAAYLPLELSHPIGRLRELVADSGSRLVLSLDRLGDLGAPGVSLNELRGALAAESPLPPPAAAQPARDAYLIYTSGSTGKPKAVVIEHHAIASYTLSVLAALELDQPRRFAWLSTPAADLGHTQIFGALLSGGTLCAIDERVAFDPIALGQKLAELRIDVLKLTPGHLRGLLDADESAQLLPGQALIFGGEQLDGSLVARVRALAPRLRVFNHYGPTEAAVGAVCWQVPDATFEGAVPLGRPLANRRLYVLDANGAPVPEGVIGQLFIGGDALAREYRGRPELTRERFLPDPFRGEGRMYATGDRVRWLTDGSLSFVGREDAQVKIRGHRVELGEVEAAIARVCPHVREVWVRALPARSGGLRLCAYYVASTALSPEKLRDDLGLYLPEVMVPSSFVALDALPRTANGKRDWARLPAAGGEERHEELVPPRDDVERALHAIWCGVLQREAVSVRDGFFALGGDSILSLQVIARARREGLTITPQQLFEHKTIERLARAIAPAAGEATAAPAPAEAERLPLTAAQRALASGARAAAPSWRLVRLPRLAAETLQPALAALLDAHGALRVRFGLRDGETPFQSPLAAAPRPLGYARLSLDDRAALDACAKAAQPFAAVWCDDTAGGDPALLVAADPMCLDDAGFAVVLAQLRQAVHDVAAGRPPRVLASGSDLFAYARFQSSWARRDDLDSAWEYWLEQPGALSQPPAGPTSGEPASYDLSVAETENLLVVCRRLCVPLPAAVTAALAVLERRACDSGSIVVDVQAGRPELSPAGRQSGEPYCDLPRLPGALTHHAPLFLELASDALDPDAVAQVAGALADRASQLAQYGALRFLSDNDYMRDSLLALPRARVAFSWLGDLDGVLAWHSARAAQEYALHVRAYLQDGRLFLAGEGPLACEWLPALARGLLALARADAPRLVPIPQAFPLCRMLARDIRYAALDGSRVEDVYPLSPMQHGMLLHTLLAPHSGIYLMQQQYEWKGELDRGALERSWQALLAQHPVLRTAFHWDDDRAPVQCVYRDVDAPVEWHDLTGAPDPRAALARVLEAELASGYDLRRAPLTRLRVFGVGPGEHVIVRSFHHILMDAWCFGIVMEELLARYRDHLEGRPFERVAPRPYRDYIAWLAAQDPAAAETYFRSRLAGWTQLTPLPGAPRPKPAAAAESVVDHVDATLTVEQSSALDAACRAQNLTANTWIQGAWALLLARHARTRDVVFGVTSSGRPAELSGVEDMLGLFINSVPLRVTADDATTLDAWLGELLAQNVELRRFEYAPLVDIARWAGRPGEALFETLVVFENAPLGAAETSAFGVQLDFAEDRVHTNYAITLVVYPGQPLGLRLSYDAARYGRPQMLALRDQLVELLAQMIASPHATLGSLSLAGPLQLARLHAWNQTGVPFPLHRSYASLVGARAAAAPDHVVARCQGEAWTYAELWRRSGAIARELVRAGVTANSVVVVAAERSLPLLAMVVGVLRARGAFLALELSQPDQRLAEIVARSGAAHAVVAPDARELWQRVAPGASCRVIVAAEQATEPGADEPLPDGAPDDLAYVVFTSGSTGVPKGVLVEQRGMLNNMFGKLPLLDIRATDRIAQTASCAFDISVWQLLAAPLLGACVEIVPDRIAHDPVRLRAALEAEQITVAEVVPAIMRGLLHAAGEGGLTSLRCLLTTGEAASPGLCRAWLARYPHTRLLNAYGPAECSDDVSMHEIRPTDPLEANIPIGRPTANNQLYVLDEGRRPLPPFVLGEIAVGGVGVGRGYLGDPELTARSFVELPWLDGARVYLTGDLGRYRDDGVLEFAGRCDEQVKVRGHRIELGEIERRLAAVDGARDAAVVAVEDARGETFLVGYCEQTAGATVTSERLRAELARQLPHYMVPSAIVLAELPRSDNGKIDRNALRARGLPALDCAQRVAARDAREAALLAIWSDILETHEIGVLDHFFEAGGHSLLATQVISRIQRQLGVSLPLRAIFEHPTVAELAVAIERAQVSEGERESLARRDHTGFLPLSFAQQRLWFLEQLHPGSTAFNLGFGLRLSGALDVDALRDALAFSIDRHEILRTAFVSVQGEPRQVIQPRVAFALEVEAAPGDGRAELRQLVERPFDLAQAPLLRARLLRTAEREHVLLLALHHIIVDAWSLGLLVQELSAAYRAFHAGARPALAPPALTYADYAIAQRQPALEPSWRASLEYHRDRLRDCSTRLSLRGARDGDERGAGRVRVRSDAALGHELARAAQRHNVTPFMLLHAALGVVLRQQSGSADFLIGTDVANRSSVETESMIGFFVNQLVLRSRVRDEDTFAALIAQSRVTILGALEYQALPFDRLVAELLPERDRRAMPFFQVKLILQNTADRALSLPDLTIEELEPPVPDAELDLLFSVQAAADGLDIAIDYRASRYDRAYVEQLAQFFMTAIRVLCEPSERTVRELVGQLERAEADSTRHALAQARSERDAQRQKITSARVRRVKVDRLA